MLLFDLETQSVSDLKKAGVYNYAIHTTTSIACMAYAESFEEYPRIWHPPDPFPYELFKRHDQFCAHNVYFEKLILQHVMGIKIPLTQWEDTAAIARSQSLPGDLETLGEYFGTPKDKKGSAIMKKLCKPRRTSKANPELFWTPRTKPEDFQRLYEYCIQDVVVMQRVYHRMKPLPKRERRIWMLTCKMNAKGLKIDKAYIPPMQRALDKEFKALDGECRDLIGVGVNQNIKFAEACGMDSVAKAPLRDALEVIDPNSIIHRALTIRQTLGKTSLRKLPTMLNRMQEDHRIRETLLYCGAERTGRWSGMGIQPQNLPRGYSGEKLTKFFSDLRDGKPIAEAHYNLSNCLKGLIIGPLIVADYSQIECRVLAWLAGQEDLIQLFRDGKSPYEAMASKIYGIPEDQIEKDSIERFLGKQVVLGAGYNMGPPKFQTMLKDIYNVRISDEEASKAIYMYRDSVPYITNFWQTVQMAFVKAIHGEVLEYRGLKFGKDRNGDTCIKLPSGRVLTYHQAHIQGGEIKYWGRDTYSHKYKFIKTYGGKITENLCQSISRDLMALAMLALNRAGFELVLTVHDEIVAEHPVDECERFRKIMLTLPPWAKGLPLDCEIKFVKRYQK